MHHCVAPSTESRAKGRSTIWSLAAEFPKGLQRLATIEVVPKAGRIEQASMVSNEELDEPCKAILRDWAARKRLILEEPAP